MSVKQIAWVVLATLLNLRGALGAGGYARVTAILYENPHGRDADGAGCDPFASGCDHQFTFCMRLLGSNACIQQYTSSVYANSYAVHFASGITNPMTFNFVDSYPGSFHLYVRVTDDDSSLLEGYVDDSVDEIGITRTMSPGSDSGQFTANGARDGKRLTLRIEANCFADFYGSSCTVYCKGRDDEGGHFTCGSNGEKICIEGWSNPSVDCRTPICGPGCDHGTCTSPGVCSCDSGYAGDTCSTPLCLEGCENGNCTEPGECNCFEDYYGNLCQHNSLFCENENPCVNGGHCTYLGNSRYTCDCPLGYNGTDCESTYDCSNDCENGGTCVIGQFTCTCPVGYTGMTCGDLVDNCVGQLCENGGTCVNALNSYTCACTVGYSGDNCSIDLDLCAGSPCENGGTCVDYGDGYYCNCPPSVSDNQRPDCSGSPCLYHQCENGTCIVSNGQATCSCFSGYFGDFCQYYRTTVDDSASTSNGGLDPIGAIGVGVGAGVPFLVVVICVPLVCVCCCRRHRKKIEATPERLNDVVVEYSASPEGVTPDKRTMAAWVNSYPDLVLEDSSQEDPSRIYDEVKEDLSSSATENFNSSVPAGYSVPTLRPQYGNSVNEALRALALQDGTNSEAPTLERSVSPPPDYHNLPSPLHRTFSGSGEGVARQTPVENNYDHPSVKFVRAEL